ncbi:uncharacterized protein ACRADG_003921 [Cochliomyia hominivorax]
MDETCSQGDTEEKSIFSKDEPEIYIASYTNQSTSGNYNIEIMDDSNIDNSRRRSKRTRIRNNRYKSDDDIEFSPESPKLDGKDSDKDFVLHEQSSTSTSARLPFSKIHTGEDPLARALKQLNLYDELYVLMKTRGITEEALKNMQPRHIDELFKGTRLGTKIVFESRLKEWQNKNCTYSYEKITTMTNGQKENLTEQLNSSLDQVFGDMDIEHLANLLTNAVRNTINTVLQDFKQTCRKRTVDKPNSELPIAIIPLKKIKVEPNSSANETIIPDKIPTKTARPCSKLMKTSDDTSASNQSVDKTISHQSKRRKLNTSVKDILLALPSGQQLFDEYDDTGMLTANQRIDIVRSVIDFHLRNNHSLTVAQCRELAEEIVELFPTESMEFYFVQEYKHSPPKGKIWDRYQTRKRALRKMNSSLIEIDSIANDVCDNNSLVKANWSDMQAMCSQLKQLKNDKELLDKWKESFAFRRNQLQTGYFSNWKLYFDEYPFCKQQNYALFIESDLETLYPDLKFNDTLWNEFIENFPSIFINRIKHPKSKILYDQLTEMENSSAHGDYVAIKVIEILHVILRPSNSKLQSVEDAQRKFTVEVNDLSDLKKIVIERKKHCTENNIQAKPYIAVVGQNKDYSHFSVILDSTGFSCDNYKDSLILCFNLYLFFNISFPHESLNVWTFIQKYFFNKPPLVRNPRVESFINDIKGEKTDNLDLRTTDMNGATK